MLPDPVEDEATLAASERTSRQGWRLRLPRWLGGSERDEVDGRKAGRSREADDEREAVRAAPEQVKEVASQDADRPPTDGELARMAALHERLRELREQEAREQAQRGRDQQRDRSWARDDSGYGL